ncbi:hypothetical protein PO909_033575 [Leuciscus waleckii]
MNESFTGLERYRDERHKLTFPQSGTERAGSLILSDPQTSVISAQSVTVTLGDLSGVPLLLIVASSKCVIPLSPLLYSGNESKAELLTRSFLFLSLGSLRWAEVCLG